MAVDSAVLKKFIADSGLRPRQNTVSYIFTCPRCHKDKKLYIRRSDGRFICWSCTGNGEGFQGRAEYALAELLDVKVRDIASKLYGDELPLLEGVWLDVKLKEWFDDDDESDGAMELDELKWPIGYYPIDHPHAQKGAQYLASRGVGLDVAVQYGIRYAPQHLRVVFPCASKGALYGWQERLVVPDKFWNETTQSTQSLIKGRTSKGMKRDRLLMFADRLEGSRHVVLCEGPMDALKAHLCGGNVATMGKKISRHQIDLIRHAGIHTVYLALDPDAGDTTSELVREFSDLDVRWLDPSPFKDLGEMDMMAVRDVFDRAPRLLGPHSRCFLLCR